MFTNKVGGVEVGTTRYAKKIGLNCSFEVQRMASVESKRKAHVNVAPT